MNRLPLTCFSLCIALAGAAHAAPVITQATGTVSEGNILTIAGSGFGSKPSASPLVFDNFEAGTVGAKVLTSKATVGQWQNGAGYDVPVYSSEQKHAGSKSVKLVARPNGAYSLSLNQNGSFPVVYMDWRVRLHYLDRPSRSWKPWRLYGNNDKLQANANLQCGASGMSIIHEGGDGGYWWDDMPFGQDKWQHYQVILRASSAPGVADGVVKQYIDGKLVSDHRNVVTRTTSAHWENIRVGHYWATDGVPECAGNSGADIFIDNIYIDTTWARVELGNASTYSASTKREIQIPVSWGANSIQLKVNAGSFTPGSQAYLYVTDADGVVNATGYPVTIGGTSVVPLPPSNVIVQ
jgi:hypothetical protein